MMEILFQTSLELPERLFKQNKNKTEDDGNGVQTL
jgi:hypothetical protein